MSKKLHQYVLEQRLIGLAVSRDELRDKMLEMATMIDPSFPPK
jgi:hypothetical protein